MINTEKGLYGINPASGEILWTHEMLKDVKKEEIQEIPGLPYILISAQLEHHDDLYKAFDVKKSSQIILDPLKGTIIFNSDTSGLKDVKYWKICLKSNSLIVIGEHKDNYMMLIMESYDLTTGKLKWSTIEIFGFKKGSTMGENMRVLENENNDLGIAGDIYEIDKNTFLFSNGKKIS